MHHVRSFPQHGRRRHRPHRGGRRRWRPARALTPGGAEESFTVEVSNTSGRSQQFEGALGATVEGALAFAGNQMSAQVTALGATPATAVQLVSQEPGVVGSFYPKGHSSSSEFTLPAHTSFSWKVSLGATRAWRVNNDGISLEVAAYQPGHPVFGSRVVDFQVGNGRTGGPVVETLTGSDSIAPGPAYLTYTVTNRTGAAIGTTWASALVVDSGSEPTQFAEAVWVGSAAKGHWQPLAYDALPTIAAGFGNGSSRTFELRVELVKYAGSTASQRAEA
ncbi:hypothetical protein GXW82_09985 [Streptacidiphilus sp. 4-A2]|nr:hypothetical protein [Streptacidiphilus sp. 4-A2]